MAVYIKWDGLDGEATDVDHQKWVDVVSVSWGVSRPTSAAQRGVGGAAGAERADFQDFSIVKTMDKASPKLALACAQGRVFPKVEIHLTRSGGENHQYMKINCYESIVTSVKTLGLGLKWVETLSVEEPVEEVSFNYGKIEWTWTSSRPGDSETTSWDLLKG